MRDSLPYPSSFPNEAEVHFIRLVLSTDAEFPVRWNDWKRGIVFDDIDPATVRLLPLLYLRLSSLGIEDDEITGRIRGAYKLAWFKNQQLLEEVRKFVEVCQEQGIPVLLLKGLALLITVYGNIGARFVSDGDLLVDPQYIPKVFALLECHGWKSQVPLLTSGNDWVKSGIGNYFHACTFRNSKDIELDLHWRAFHIIETTVPMLLLREPPQVTDSNSLHWQNSVVTEFKGTTMRVLSPEDMLLHVIEHGTMADPLRPLRWVIDAAHIVRKAALDYNRLMDMARIAGLEIHLLLGLRFLEEHAGVAMPVSFMRALEQMPLTPKAIKDYYQFAEQRPLALGRFPRHWYIYWKMGPSDRLLARWIGLPRYLRTAWGIEGKKSLGRFIFEKCRVRLDRCLARIKAGVTSRPMRQ